MLFLGTMITGPDCPIIPVQQDFAKSAYHIYVIQLRIDLLRVRRKEIFTALKAENLGVNVHYIPLHLQPFYQNRYGYKRGDYPKAEKYYDRAITLPIYPKMNNEHVEDVINAVRKVITYFSKTH